MVAPVVQVACNGARFTEVQNYGAILERGKIWAAAKAANAAAAFAFRTAAAEIGERCAVANAAEAVAFRTIGATYIGTQGHHPPDAGGPSSEIRL